MPARKKTTTTVSRRNKKMQEGGFVGALVKGLLNIGLPLLSSALSGKGMHKLPSDVKFTGRSNINRKI